MIFELHHSIYLYYLAFNCKEELSLFPCLLIYLFVYIGMDLGIIILLSELEFITIITHFDAQIPQIWPKELLVDPCVPSCFEHNFLSGTTSGFGFLFDFPFPRPGISFFSWNLFDFHFLGSSGGPQKGQLPCLSSSSCDLVGMHFKFSQGLNSFIIYSNNNLVIYIIFMFNFLYLLLFL